MYTCLCPDLIFGIAPVGDEANYVIFFISLIAREWVMMELRKEDMNKVKIGSFKRRK